MVLGKKKGTNDQLVRHETFIRDAFVSKEHAVSIFFELEKAYDTTWKYGILKDLHSIGLEGNLPNFIKKILGNFNIRLGSTYSDNFEQEMGVPQGSNTILSVTLFSIKINSLAQVPRDGMQDSLYVDDFITCICYKSKNINSFERQLQLCFHKIQKWADENGFKFSKTNTACV